MGNQHQTTAPLPVNNGTAHFIATVSILRYAEGLSPMCGNYGVVECCSPEASTGCKYMIPASRTDSFDKSNLQFYSSCSSICSKDHLTPSCCSSLLMGSLTTLTMLIVQDLIDVINIKIQSGRRLSFMSK